MPENRRQPTLGIETSTRTASVALALAGETRERELERQRAHASDLLPAIRALLEEADLSPSDVRRIVVGTGPGSFTGLRVGIATALGLARGTGAALLGLSSFEAHAFASLRPGELGAFVRDARASRIYLARYSRTESDVEVLESPAARSAEEASARIGVEDRVFADEAVVALLPAGTVSPERVRDATPRARDLLALAPLRAWPAHGALEPVRPLYLMPFGRTRPTGTQRRTTSDPRVEGRS